MSMKTLVPSNVNRTLGGTTCPGWKTSCYGLQRHVFETGKRSRL